MEKIKKKIATDGHVKITFEKKNNMIIILFKLYLIADKILFVAIK